MRDQKGDGNCGYRNDTQSGGRKQEDGRNAKSEHPVKNDEIFSGTHFPDADRIDQRNTPKSRQQENKTGNYQKPVVVHKLIIGSFHALHDGGNEGLIGSGDKKKSPE